MSSEKGLARHELGFLYMDPLPSQEDLKKFYEEKYFQDNHGQYEQAYTEKEIEWFQLDAEIANHIFEREFPEVEKTALDIGCGEGYFMRRLHNRGWRVNGCDFSKWAIQKRNPEVFHLFEQGNVYELLEKYQNEGKKYSLVNLSNVLEHVLDPVKLLFSMKKLIHEKGIIRIMVPNDFSEFQKFLIEEGKIDRKFWLNTPEHVNYFNLDSLVGTAEKCGFRIVKVLADFEIQQFLMHERSNYIKDPTAGKQAHYARVDLDLFFSSQNLDAYIRMREAEAQAGMGRDLVIFLAAQ